MLATGPSNPLAVWVWTRYTLQFGSRSVQEPDLKLPGMPRPYPYPSSRGCCRVWLDLSGPNSSYCFRVFLLMVGFRYPTVMRTILTVVHHCLYLLYRLPFFSKQAEISSLLLPDVQCDRFFILHHEYDLRYKTALLTVIETQLDKFAPVTAPTTFRELMEILDSICGKLHCRKECHEQMIAI